LIREARIFLNQLNPSNSFWSDEELTNYANDAIRQYFLIVNDQSEGQFDVVANIDIVAGQEAYNLPSDFFEMRALYYVGSTQNTMLRYYNNLSESYETQSVNYTDQYAPYYYFRMQEVVLRPIPGFSQAGGLLLEYTQFPQTLITGGDSMTSAISPVFKELVVKYMCYQAKLKESSVQGTDTYSPVEQHLNTLYEKFKITVGGRSKYPQFVKPFSP
jgi:hypothetical protein